MSTTTRSTHDDLEAAKALAVRSMQIMVDGIFSDFEAVVHPDALNREGKDEPPACRGRGPAAFYATALWLREMFADLQFELHEVVAEGDLVAVHNTMSGRQVGTFTAYDENGDVREAFPATGQPFATTQSHWLRIRDGQVIEHWANRDDLGTAVQLGWVPPSPLFLLRSKLALRKLRKRAKQAK